MQSGFSSPPQLPAALPISPVSKMFVSARMDQSWHEGLHIFTPRLFFINQHLCVKVRLQKF